MNCYFFVHNHIFGHNLDIIWTHIWTIYLDNIFGHNLHKKTPLIQHLMIPSQFNSEQDHEDCCTISVEGLWALNMLR